MGRTENGDEPEIEVPLLENLYPDCPGCKCAHLHAKGAGPPVKELVMVAMVVLANALPISSLFPFLYFMIKDFQIASRPEDIGYYAGAVGSIFMFGRLISSMAWGLFADKYGRRPVFALGLLSVIIFQLIFGSAHSFWVAFTARFLLGAFNGMLGPLKAYASEICNEESQAWGLSVVSTSWSIGLIIGPAMGGFLARPTYNFPSIFKEDSFFARFPYLLPSIIQAVMSFFTLAVVYYLPETIHKHDKKTGFSDVEQKLIEEDQDENNTITSLWSNWAVMTSVSVYCVWCLYEISMSEVFSLWAVSPVTSGGLGLSTADVGIILAVSGFAVFCFNMTLFPYMANKLGPILVTRIPAIVTVPLLAMFPFVSILPGNLEWYAVNILQVIRNICSTVVVTGSFILLNNAVPTKLRGAANGLSLSCVSLFRTFGPAGAGAAFAWSQSRHDTNILPGSELVFFLMMLVCTLGVLTTLPPYLPTSLSRAYDVTHPKKRVVGEDFRKSTHEER